MADVVCMGECLVDFVSTERNVPLSSGPGFTAAPGGAPANVAVGLQRLGMGARFVGKVGDDPFGEFLRESLNETGVDTTYLLTDSSARTTAVFVGVWDDGRKDMCLYRNPGADMMLAPEEIIEPMLGGARCFHFGSIGFINEPCASAHRKAVRLARDMGLMISYDPNYRPTFWPDIDRAKSIIRDTFSYCHLAKVSEEEWDIVTGCDDIDGGIAAILDRGVELLVVSRGPKGAFATNGDYRIAVPTWDVDVVETTGAGDGFLAALITRLLPERERLGSLANAPKETVEDALRFATAVGALPALPTMAEVEGFIGSF